MLDISSLQMLRATFHKVFVKSCIWLVPAQTSWFCRTPSAASISGRTNILKLTNIILTQVNRPGILSLLWCRQMNIPTMDGKFSTIVVRCHKWGFFHITANVTFPSLLVRQNCEEDKEEVKEEETVCNWCNQKRWL